MSDPSAFDPSAHDPRVLSPIGLRIIGVLAEKERTVPDSYPLTEAALLSGCNQKSNRDPEMSLELSDLRAPLRALLAAGWAYQIDSAGGRAPRFRHELTTQLGLDALGQAILTELLVRGPQAVGALRGRMSRFEVVATDTDVERTLQKMAARPTPLAVCLERRPRERYPRWAHTLAPVEEAVETTDSRPSSAPPPTPPAATSPTKTSAPPTSAAHNPPGATPSPNDLIARIAALEARVAALEARAPT